MIIRTVFRFLVIALCFRTSIGINTQVYYGRDDICASSYLTDSSLTAGRIKCAAACDVTSRCIGFEVRNDDSCRLVSGSRSCSNSGTSVFVSDSSVVTTEAPVATTEAPVATTEAPVATTEATVATTEAPVVTTTAPVCTGSATLIGNNCYIHYSDKQTRQSAMRLCYKAGGKLAEPETLNELVKLITWADSKEDGDKDLILAYQVYISGYAIEVKFTDGRDVTFAPTTAEGWKKEPSVSPSNMYIRYKDGIDPPIEWKADDKEKAYACQMS